MRSYVHERLAVKCIFRTAKMYTDGILLSLRACIYKPGIIPVPEQNENKLVIMVINLDL
jgi:hypothetical protein